MTSSRRVEFPAEDCHTEATAAEPPDFKSLEKLLSEIQDAIDRDQQFLIRAEELLARWKVVARRMLERFRDVLGADRVGG
jgi:hypothetical protein